MNQGLTYEIEAVIPLTLETGLFVSLATIYGRDRVQGPTGNFIDSYRPISGLMDIPCMDTPTSPNRVQANEVRQIQQILSIGMRHVLLNRCFTDAPNWANEAYRVDVDGVMYELWGAENDSQTQMTRLELRLVQVQA